MIKAYKIVLSNGREIKIDEDELNAAMEAVNTGSIGKMRQGIFNPSFLVAIIVDEERINQFQEAITSAEQRKQLRPDTQIPVGLKSLDDIFSNIKQLK